MVGATQKSLPQTWNELKIRIAITSPAGFDINVDFTLIKEELYTTPLFMDNGNRNSLFRIYVGYYTYELNSAFLWTDGESQIRDLTSSATTYFWYR